MYFAIGMGVAPVNDGWVVERFFWDYAPPWAGSQPVTRTTTDAAVIFHTRAFPVSDLAELVEEARASLGQLLPDVRSEQYLVLAAPSSGDYRLAGGSGVAGVLTRQITRGREFELTQLWVLVDGEKWAGSDTEFRRTLILHEVTHAILAPYTSHFVPAWVSEGLAMYFSQDPGLEVLQDQPELLDRTTLREIASGPGLGEFFARDTAVNYAMAGAAVSFLMERFGEQEVLALLGEYQEEVTDEEIERTFNQPLYIPEATRMLLRSLANDLTGRLLPRLFDLDMDRLDAGAKQWIRERL